MRRDYFSLNVSNVDWVEENGDPAQPTVTIDFDGPATTLRERLTGPDGNGLDAEETDVAYRLRSSLDEDDAEGVVSVTNRITGEFILELNQEADDVLQFIRAARRYGEHNPDDDGRYFVQLLVDDEVLFEQHKNTFLVYNESGNLLREHSLIPSGIEL